MNHTNPDLEIVEVSDNKRRTIIQQILTLVKPKGDVLDAFGFLTGVRQGDRLSPFYFSTIFLRNSYMAKVNDLKN